LLASEIQAWMPSLIALLIRRAVQRLPGELQERMNEEWQAFINDTPGTVFKLIRACGLMAGARRISSLQVDIDWADRIISRCLGALWLFAAALTILVVAVAARLENRGPLFERAEFRINGVAHPVYHFGLGSGPASNFLRRTRLQTLPILFSLLSGKVVIPRNVLRKLARIVLLGS
jgi:hypothetical protein